MRNALKSVQGKIDARRADVTQDTEEKEAGVSGIIELVIVLVILGILTAILLPTFLGTTSTAKNRSAQSNLSTAVTDLQTAYANSSSNFGSSATLVTSVQAADPGLTITAANATPVTTAGNMTIQNVSGNQTIVGVYSAGANSGAGGCIYASVNNAAAVTTGITGLAGVSYTTTTTGCQTLSTAQTWLTTLP